MSNAKTNHGPATRQLIASLPSLTPELGDRARRHIAGCNSPSTPSASHKAA